MNLLVIPWPFDIAPRQFQEVPCLAGELRNMPNGFGFFRFSQKSSSPTAPEKVKALFLKAKEDMGQIDGVVLPELSITEDEHSAISDFVLDHQAFLVAGVGAEPANVTEHGTNQACFDLPYQEAIVQKKHHRWKLDSSQIRQYGLGARLDPERQFWEHIDISDRRLVFASLQPSL